MEKKDKCIVEKCNRPWRIKKHLLCASHVAQLYRRGKVGGEIIRQKRVFNQYRPTRSIQKAPKKGNIPLALIKKAVKEVSK